jgi:putative DNA primase/helicase
MKEEKSSAAATPDSTPKKLNLITTQTPTAQPEKPKAPELFPLKPPTDLLAKKEIMSGLVNAAQTDAGNGERFALLFKDNLRYCKSRKKWLKWNRNIWAIDEGAEAHRAAIITMRATKYAASFVKNSNLKTNLEKWATNSESVAKRNAIINTAMNLKPIETAIEDYDQNQLLAAVKNGTLDLSTGQFRDSAREDYISMQFNVEYDPLAKAPRWETFLKEVFAGDEELISWTQRAVGYSLTGDTSEQVMFMLYGSGANGKSVFLEIISYLMGDYSANTPFSTFEASKRNESTNDLAALKGKRLVTAIETNEDRRLDEARVKSVTGQDEITARFLFQEFFTYRPNFKIWMAVNHKPLIKGTDRGIWRRIRLVPFTQSFEGKADKELINKLKAELSGILNWALDGLQQWKKHGLGNANAIGAASKEYQRESDLVQQWMDECVTLEATEKTPCADAYATFKEWAKNRGYPIFSMNSFARNMTEKGFERKSTGKQRVYVGLKLDEPPLISFTH